MKMVSVHNKTELKLDILKEKIAILLYFSYLNSHNVIKNSLK